MAREPARERRLAPQDPRCSGPTPERRRLLGAPLWSSAHSSLLIEGKIGPGATNRRRLESSPVAAFLLTPGASLTPTWERKSWKSLTTQQEVISPSGSPATIQGLGTNDSAESDFSHWWSEITLNKDAIMAKLESITRGRVGRPGDMIAGKAPRPPKAPCLQNRSSSRRQPSRNASQERTAMLIESDDRLGQLLSLTEKDEPPAPPSTLVNVGSYI